jgi:cytochrome c biogenesis protein CcmG, thiol:disulfide interchange protein DsbE
MSKTARATIVLLFAGGALAFYLGHRSNDQAGVQVGDQAPDFTLPGLEGGSISLTQFRGQVAVVNFWATWCPPCIAETPSLEKFAAKVKPLGITVIGVSVDEDPAALRKFVADHHLTFPIARDPQQDVPARFGTFQLPETYIIDRDGRVAEKIINAYDWEDPRMVEFVKSLAAGGR